MWILIQAYIIVMVLFLHLSILTCTPSDCPLIPVEGFSYIPQGMIGFAFQLFKHIPVSIELLHLLAQFLIIGDIVFVVIFLVRIFFALFSRIFWTLLYSVLVSLIVYVLINYYHQGVFNSENIQAFIDQVKDTVNSLLASGSKTKG